MNDIKTVCVSTYCTPTSYGSILQSYALKCTLLALGIDSFLLADRKHSSKEYTRSFFRPNIRSLVIESYKRIFRRKIQIQYKGSQSFINSYMDIRYYGEYEQLLKELPVADAYISGSDQVFHPDLCNPLFFLDFVPDNSKKFTYAVSMGKTIVPDCNKEKLTGYLKGFNTISVREKSNIEVLKQYCNANFEVNIDPTFLLSIEDWKKIETPYEIKKPYILVYPLYWDTKFNGELKKLHKETGLEVVVLSSGFNRVWGSRKLFDINVQQFLWLIDHAEAVVTSSFHGVALSTIFNKQVAILVNPELPSRIQDISDTLGLEQVPIAKIVNHKIDYSPINKRISEEKVKSIEYLRGIFNVK